MKKEEKIASDYIEKRYFTKPISEPDGNVPPDLLIIDIAIEVRRLNENRLLPKGFQGIEQLHFKFKSIINRISKKIRYNGIKSYFISYTVKNTDLRLLENQLLIKLRDLYNRMPDKESFNLCNIKFSVFPAIKLKCSYTVGGFIDRDEGGFEADIYVRNIKLCIDDKTTKVKLNAIIFYKHWWIILIDHLKLSPLSQVAINEILKIDKHFFEKVIIIDKYCKEIIEY